VLDALKPEQIENLVSRAIKDDKRGLGQYGLEISDDAKSQLAEACFGDARRALTTLETAADLAMQHSKKLIDEDLLVEAMQHKVLRYDKKGDEHYNLVSALIKSMRGSDPDATIYWMTRMLEAGEDPIFILRRMLIFASEDIGHADPQALQVAVGAMDSFRYIGMPEGIFPLTQVATYLACAPKSNSSLKAWAAARKDVGEYGSLPVPMNIRNAPTSLMKSIGYGKNYKYPHNFDGHYVPDQYLPDKLRGKRYFNPSNEGHEKKLAERLEKLREIAVKKKDEENEQ